MELHSPVATKRLWSYLRVAFFMLRKGIISKRKLIMDINLMMKRGKLMGKACGSHVSKRKLITDINLMMKRGKLMGKACGSHVFNHNRARPRGHGYGLQEYEFSCNNSPNPVFFHAKRNTFHNYFPCIGAVAEEEEEGSPSVPSAVTAAALPGLHYSPNSSAAASEDEEEEESGAVSSDNGEVDDEAEKFIRSFYEQLRRQSRFALLQYEIDYQEMLARGR